MWQGVSNHDRGVAFMYTSYTNQEAKVQAMLQSFTWGVKKGK